MLSVITTPLLAFTLVLLGSLGLTAACLVLLRHWQILDRPNRRSSHVLPTPKGGGVGFALVIVGVLLVTARGGGGDELPLLALALTSLALMVVGALDDWFSLPAAVRLAAQVLLAIAFLASFAAPPAILPGHFSLPAWLAWGMACLWLVWNTNLYNFMDGIDGLAILQAILASAAAFALMLIGTGTANADPLPLLLAGAGLGFMAWNFPPARLFMGDAGSTFLGFVLAGLSLYYSRSNPDLLALWLILLAGFVGDATLTLAVRLLRGEKPHVAHRSHFYQHCVRRREARLLHQGMTPPRARKGAHRYYLATFTLVFLFWQLPLASLVVLERVGALEALLLTYAPLLLAALAGGAGRPEKPMDENGNED